MYWYPILFLSLLAKIVFAPAYIYSSANVKPVMSIPSTEDFREGNKSKFVLLST